MPTPFFLWVAFLFGAATGLWLAKAGPNRFADTVLVLLALGAVLTIGYLVVLGFAVQMIALRVL